MKKKYWKHLSFILQGIYCAACICDMILCLTYRQNFDTVLGHTCADWAFNLTGILFFVPAMPIGIVLNLLAMPPRQSQSTQRKRWLIWSVISPMIYLICCISAICVFVATTGGV
ncbi:MAG: hypothetical protein IJ955_10015 [Oscillospiraceae bacterium]|nr:hypothetical protein [Oscillospiraceae bacterium]